MHPSGLPPPQNRSCPSPSLAQCPSPSPSLLHQQQQQQQQHVIYGPVTTLQPCPTNIHPHCLYTGIQRNPGLTGSSGTLSNQVPIRHAKVTKWQPKSKPNRGHHHHHHHHHSNHHHNQSHHQQFCQPVQHQQNHVQQPLSYLPKPLVIFDQCQTNQATSGVTPSATSFLVASSSFGHSPYGPGDHYPSATGLTLVPQPFFKPPEVAQAFCLLPERPQAPQHHHQHHLQQTLLAQPQASFYNISATNACNVQSINPKSNYHLANVTNPYGNVTTFGNNQLTSDHPSTSQIFQNSRMTFGSSSREKSSILSGIDVQGINRLRNPTDSEEAKHQESLISRTECIDWPARKIGETCGDIFEVPEAIPSSRISPVQTNGLCSSTITKNQEERFSDESAASFDFTIEAEKMVSALCNTVSSNDLGKDDSRGRNETSTSFGGAAGDNGTDKTSTWFADFCNEYGVSMGRNNRSMGTQTQEDRHDPQSYPEMMRKCIYQGCNEAETILNSSCHRNNSKAGWLANVSRATRTAVAKSSTCFPIFSGDKTFVRDLINAFLRINNGWLILDNYLNKQHYPSLDEKFDRELTSRFHTWEVATEDLSKELIKTLTNLEESVASNSLEQLGFRENQTDTSFPGDVNLYTNNDLFDFSQRDQDRDRDATYTVRYPSRSVTNDQCFRSSDSRQQQSQKETKLRSKWTITENLSSTIDGGISVADHSTNRDDLGLSTTNRFRVKNSSNASTTRITSSSRHSLNAEFFHLRNKVMESMSSSNDLDGEQHWGLKKQRYDFVFGRSMDDKTSNIVTAACEPIFKIRSAGSTYENAAYARRRCLPSLDSTMTVVNKATTTTSSHCSNANESVCAVAGNETHLDSTGMTGSITKDGNETYKESDYTGKVGLGELKEDDCASGTIVSGTSTSSIKMEPVYVGKSSSDQRELATVPRTKMTLLSQIEGDTPSADRDTREMTANLSAWFASMRNANGSGRMNCPVDARKNEGPIVTRTSTHPQETSRSAMDLNRQLHMDGNRQLQTLQNMQALQSQPWNAANLLNNKRVINTVVRRGLDEYDSSEDVRVYMKPGSYNVPKKRHHRKNLRKCDLLPGYRGTGNNRLGHGSCYNTSVKNHQVATSVSSFLIASSVQVSATTTTTSTSIRVPFPASPIVPPPSSFGIEKSPTILRRVKSFTDQENRQDVAWKAACASAEILLETLNVKGSCQIRNPDSTIPNSVKTLPIVATSRDDRSEDRSFDKDEKSKNKDEDLFCEASSYESSEDDSSSTCKPISADLCPELKLRDVKQPKTNVKTDFWLIRTLNNASAVSAIDARESDGETTIGESIGSSIHDDRYERKNVVTSTPEPVRTTTKADPVDSTTVEEKSIDSSPRNMENLERSRSGERRESSRNVSISLIDSSAEFIGRATYSETVRRSVGKSCVSGKIESSRSRQTRSVSSIDPTIKNSIVPSFGKKCQRKENDKNNQPIHKSRKTTAKKLSKDTEEKDGEEGKSTKKIVKEDTSGENSLKSLPIKCQTKKKDDGGNLTSGGLNDTKSKGSERGWSVWYSSRRKQPLSTAAINKLATIHQTVWQMDDSKLLKYPSTISTGNGTSMDVIDDDGKVIKSPIFLETIGYKLKNRIYHKIEHVMRDFRKIVNNSKLYHKNDTDHLAKIETLSKRLDELFEENFSSWDVDSVSESSKNNNGSSIVEVSRCKSPQRQRQKSVSSRSTNLTKKNSAALTKNEN